MAIVKQVLLVDDDPRQLSLRRLLLERSGVASQMAGAAQAALVLLRSEAGQQNIGLVVTDHLMPDMDGAEFVRQVRDFSPNIPVIVISGLPDASDDYGALNVQFLQKPCEPEELIASVRDALAEDREPAAVENDGY